MQHFIYDAETQRETFFLSSFLEAPNKQKNEENAFLYQSRLLSGDGFRVKMILEDFN